MDELENIPEMWKHQKQGVYDGMLQPNYAYFFEMGTGKTRTMIEVLRRRYEQQGRFMKTLILGPQVVCANWVSEITRFSKIAEYKILNLGDVTGIKRMSTLEKYGTRPIIITNYESFRSTKIYNFIEEYQPEILICDESHRCKSNKAQVSRHVQKLADMAKHVYLLTGTPITNSIEDVWQQFRILDGGKTFGDSFWTFRARWLRDENEQWKGKQGYFPKWKPRESRFVEFSQLMAKTSTVVKKADCLDLPPLIRVKYPVQLGKKQAKHYQEMKNEYVTFVESMITTEQPAAAVAQLALTKTLRMQQIISGFMKLDNDTVHGIVDNPRLNALRDLLQDVTEEHKVIVWANFQQNYHDIVEVCRKLGIGYVELHGGVPKGERADCIKVFNEHPDVRVLIGNQGAGGIGVNLTAASYMIYYSKTYNLEHDLQSEARNYRGGSEVHEKITRIDLVAEGTIDEVINEALERKQNLADTILNWK